MATHEIHQEPTQADKIKTLLWVIVATAVSTALVVFVGDLFLGTGH